MQNTKIAADLLVPKMAVVFVGLRRVSKRFTINWIHIVGQRPFLRFGDLWIEGHCSIQLLNIKTSYNHIELGYWRYYYPDLVIENSVLSNDRNSLNTIKSFIGFHKTRSPNNAHNLKRQISKICPG